MRYAVNAEGYKEMFKDLVKLTVILILWFECIELKKNIINVSLLLCIKASKTTIEDFVHPIVS